MSLSRRIVALASLLVLSAACTNTDLSSGETITAGGTAGGVTSPAAAAE